MNKIYKSKNDGVFFEVLDGASLSDEFEELKENTVDASLEKHVPVIEKLEGGYLVKVGAEPHPMAEEHYIVWIELHSEGRVQRAHLKPGEAPEATFLTGATDVQARIYCNIHGLWNSENN